MKPITINGKNVTHIHFIGIGGSSMSGLAMMLLRDGYSVSGSDKNASDKTARLEAAGVRVMIGQNARNITSMIDSGTVADLVVYTAFKPDDTGPVELEQARRSGLTAIKRSELLGLIMEMYGKGIAVAGTHGKTTTTSMVSMILLEAGLDPGIHIGSEIAALGGGSTYNGSGEYFVTEACEYVNSYHDLKPFASVVLNVDLDHLDFFSDLDEIKKSFAHFADLTRKDGFLVINGDDLNSLDTFAHAPVRKVLFGLSEREDLDYNAKNIAFDADGNGSYDLVQRGRVVCSVTLHVPGTHLLLDSVAASALALEIGCKPESVVSGIDKYRGAKKRSEILGVKKGVTVIDDYAHHPTEVRVTLEAVKRSTPNKLWCVFQPHTYTRTYKLMKELTESFGSADEIIVSDIYAAREPDTGLVHASQLADRLAANGASARYIREFEDIAAYLATHVKEGDKVITMGAGTIEKVGIRLLELL